MWAPSHSVWHSALSPTDGKSAAYTVSGCHHHCLCGKRMGCVLTQIYLESCHISAWGVTSQGDGWMPATCACSICPRTLCSSIGTKHGSGWRRFVYWPHCSLPLTSIHKQHWHTNRQEWTAESIRKCWVVVGRKNGLLSMALYELHTLLSSQASVLMERFLWKDSVVEGFLGGIHY